MALQRSFGDSNRGQTTAEYVGLLVVIAAVLIAVASSRIDAAAGGLLREAVCRVAQLACEPTPATQPAGSAMEAAASVEAQAVRETSLNDALVVLPGAGDLLPPETPAPDEGVLCVIVEFVTAGGPGLCLPPEPGTDVLPGPPLPPAHPAPIPPPPAEPAPAPPVLEPPPLPPPGVDQDAHDPSGGQVTEEETEAGGTETTPGTIDETAREFEPQERPIAELLAQEGHGVVALPESPVEGQKSPDALVDGEPTEFKTVGPGADNNTIKNRLNEAKRQAPNVIIDARPSDLSEAEARRGVARILGVARDRFRTIRIVGPDYEVLYP